MGQIREENSLVGDMLGVPQALLFLELKGRDLHERSQSWASFLPEPCFYVFMMVSCGHYWVHVVKRGSRSQVMVSIVFMGLIVGILGVDDGRRHLSLKDGTHGMRLFSLGHLVEQFRTTFHLVDQTLELSLILCYELRVVQNTRLGRS